MKSLKQKFREIEALDLKLAKKMQILREKYRSKSLDIISDEFAALVKDMPELVHSICWTAYTPYWNDGEECVYRVNTPFFVMEEYKGDEYYGLSGCDGGFKFSKSSQTILESLNHLLDIKSGKKKPTESELKWQFGVRPSGYLSHYDPIPTAIDYEKLNKLIVDEEERYAQSLEEEELFPPRVKEEIHKKFGAAKDFIDRIPDNIMLSVFGDHVFVCLKRDSIDVSEYDHE